MEELNEQLSYVLSVPSITTFISDVDSRDFNPFIPMPVYAGNTPPQVSPVGDGNNNSSGLTISGAFFNNT